MLTLRIIVGSALKWLAFILLSLFWMTAAILSRFITADANVPLSWARRFWSRGCLSITGCTLTIAPGFVPEPDKPYIFAMNHQSMFDIPVAFVGIPVPLRFIAKKILKAIPFLGWYMMATGMIFVDRRNREQALRSLDDACALIRSGKCVLVYPEGTRAQPGGPILPFKKGPFVMAIQAGVPIVPVAIEGGARVLPRDSLRVVPTAIRLALGQPIATAGLQPEDLEGLMERVRNAVIDLNLSIGGVGGDKTATVAAAGMEGLGQPHLAMTKARHRAEEAMPAIAS